jgi:hypothetical protein
LSWSLRLFLPGLGWKPEGPEWENGQSRHTGVGRRHSRRDRHTSSATPSNRVACGRAKRSHSV